MNVDRRAFAFLALLPLAACGGPEAGSIRLYPIAGPIADADPASVIEVDTGLENETSGPITIKLPEPNKLKCTGTWTSVAPKVKSRERGLSLTIRETGGRYKNATSDVGGVNTGEIYAICNDGTRIQGNFISGSGTKSGTGTATDTLGNSYKLLF